MELEDPMFTAKVTGNKHPIGSSKYLSEFQTHASVLSVEKSLDVSSLIEASQKFFEEEISDASSTCESENDKSSPQNGKIKSKYSDQFLKKEWQEEKVKFYNLKSIGSERKWLTDILLGDDSDSSNESETEVTEEELQEMLKLHVQKKRIVKSFSNNTESCQDEFSYYSSSLILDHDKYHDRQKKRKKQSKILPKVNKRVSVKISKKNLKKKNAAKQKLLEAKRQRLQQQHERDMLYKRRKVWHFISKKEIPKICRNKTNTRGTSLATLKKIAQACQRDRRKEAARSQKISKEVFPRAKRMAREMLLYWKKFDKVEKEHRKKAEKEAMEQRKQDEEMREMKRQQRKLNFLITQTELYAHFMSRKIKGSQDVTTQNDILKKLDDSSNSVQRSVQGGVLVNKDIDEYDPEVMKSKALITAQNAVLSQEKKINVFDKNGIEKGAPQKTFDTTFSLANPTLNKEKELPQPEIFNGKLKSYQLKGMNWLINLYEQGINGILADEMGLGKTVQSITFLAYLAETHDIWGPFLVVAPASTLHNWQQEFARFMPKFKVLPYWGDQNDRKSLRKFWNQTSSHLTDSEKAPFHVLITSYQLIVQDVKYFQRIKWQYLILDEAHAIKSSSSLRWKILLGYNCRNRLLLTGTPIQNTMAELWALLHFIMPTLFDSHDEFNEWFSKDIENHASEKKPNLDQNQLSRLHMILKPFMLRRVKKDVENELSEKIEIKVICEMSRRQRLFYQAVKNKIMFEDLLQSTTSNSEKSTTLLMNLVMQFRKVCNHPELFERKEPSTGLFFQLPPLIISKMFYRNGLLEGLPYKQTSIYEKLLLIWNPQHIHNSLQEGGSCFGFSRFINLSPKECFLLFRSLVFRLIYCLLKIEMTQRRPTHNFTQTQQDTKSHTKNTNRKKYLSRKDLLICSPSITTTYENEDLLFIRPTTSCSGFTSCKITEISKNEIIQKEPVIRDCEAVEYPRFLSACIQKVYSPPVEVYCSDRSAAYQYKRRVFGTDELLSLYRSGIHSLSKKDRNILFFPPLECGLDAIRPPNGWSRVRVPDPTALLSDSGKLMVLDQLLTQMKKEDHRVLIYSQMTKMIDILEEFMNFRQHSYMRLDGSSKISDRRDMVNDFQSRDDIFAFLLSTRAGGLGINLTAADTVIFYDSDWNPTVDQQAMDRAHRLGQKRQVTVYRLVTKGTVEEKILNRAREKSEIQNIVISGGQFNKDVLRPKEVVSLLLDDVELEAKLKQRQAEKKLAELSGRRPGRKRKNPVVVEANNSEAAKVMKTEMEHSDSVSSMSDFLRRNDSVESFDENSMSSVDFQGMLSEQSNDVSSRPPSALGSNSPVQTPPGTTGKRRGRGRGRGRGGKTKSGSLAQAAASVAAAAGAMAGRDAAYAQYGYSFQKTS